VAKRFFRQGVRLEAGTVSGTFYYARDHLGSIRELIDAAGEVRARYSYDPFGRRRRTAGDLESDLGFAGMFHSAETGLDLTKFRAYDPNSGRWLSRDPLKSAELLQGPNLYAYVDNDPLNRIDPLGLACCGDELSSLIEAQVIMSVLCGALIAAAIASGTPAAPGAIPLAFVIGVICGGAIAHFGAALHDYLDCRKKRCTPPKCDPNIPVTRENAAGCRA
jgi:RHS repeat-associated protein